MRPAPEPLRPIRSAKHAIRTAFARYADFRGRATRAEFWWFYAFVTVGTWLLSFLLHIMEGREGSEAVYYLGGDTDFPLFYAMQGMMWGFCLVTLLPMAAVTVRRLHDVDYSGRWVCVFYLIQLLRFLPSIPLIHTHAPADMALFCAFFDFKSLLRPLAFSFELLILALAALDSQRGRNRYGISPKYPTFLT